MDVRLKFYRGSWYAVWREGSETKRSALRTKDRAVAERALKGFKVSQAEPVGHSVNALYEAYMADKGTERARWAWNKMKPYFGGLLPHEVTKEACQAYAAKRREDKVSDGTTHTELTFLRAALRLADKQTPAVVVLPQKPAPREYHLTHDEYDALLAAAVTPHVRLFIVLALATAARMAAILDLTWDPDRIDFERGTIRLAKHSERRRKGRATVPMTGRARTELEAAYSARTCNHVIEYGGKQVGKIRKAFLAAAARAGLTECTPHALRHTAAVWMAEAGVPMAEISQYLGHSDSKITEKVYARFSPQHLRGAAKALDR